MSTFALSERVAIDELIARYCQVVGIMRMQGTDQLRAVPGNVAAQGLCRANDAWLSKSVTVTSVS
jgi:hypothetical protein